MTSPKVNELRKEITFLECEKAWTTSMIALLMSEANLADKEIERLTKQGLICNEKIRDLKAELKDTE